MLRCLHGRSWKLSGEEEAHVNKATERPLERHPVLAARSDGAARYALGGAWVGRCRHAVRAVSLHRDNHHSQNATAAICTVPFEQQMRLSTTHHMLTGQARLGCPHRSCSPCLYFGMGRDTRYHLARYQVSPLLNLPVMAGSNSCTKPQTVGSRGGVVVRRIWTSVLCPCSSVCSLCGSAHEQTPFLNRHQG